MGSLSIKSYIVHQHLRRIMPNVRQAIIWCSQLWRETNPQIHMKQIKDV